MSTAENKQRDYRFQELQVHTSAAPDHLDWLDEFLLPWFHSDGLGNAGEQWHVSLREEEEPCRALLDAPRAGPDVAGFILDGSPALLEPRLDARGEYWLGDNTLRVFCRVENNRIEILGQPGARENRFALARLVRELCMEKAFACGHPVLHSAAVTHAGKTALIMGDKGAGKTTLSMHCVTRLGFGFVANDRAAVIPAADGAYQVHGVPTLVRVRNSSIPLLPELPWDRLNQAYCSRQTLANALAASAQDGGDSSARSAKTAKFLSPGQHCWLMDTPATANAPLGVLLFPQVEPDMQGLSLDPLPPQKILALLRGGLFNRYAAAEPDRLFARAATDMPATVRMLEDIATRIPGYRCLLGKNAFEDGDTLPRVLAELQ